MSPLALSLHFLQAQPDSRLVALARDGHEPAFEALVRRYRNELLAYCQCVHSGGGGAEDAVQQTFLRAWRALSAGTEVRDVRPWLYRIAHNVTLNNLRVVAPIPQEVPERAGGRGVHELVEQRLAARAALADVAALPELQREAFLSTTLDGASHEDVAVALGLSSGAVRGLVYRARATLRAAAAALTPTPVLHWAIRRADTRAGGARALLESLAGGGGAGVAAVAAKGGVVLTLAGAVAGGALLAPSIISRHHIHRSRVVPARSLIHPGAASRGPAAPTLSALLASSHAAGTPVAALSGSAPTAIGAADAHSRRQDHGPSSRSGRASGGRTSGRSDGGSKGGGSGGSEGGSHGTSSG